MEKQISRKSFIIFYVYLGVVAVYTDVDLAPELADVAGGDVAAVAEGVAADVAATRETKTDMNFSVTGIMLCLNLVRGLHQISLTSYKCVL